ncbi:MAG: ABC transporter permease [Armatimonadetes bacterium]|nr:ABC transporter permease [Armatimonadota bacterium]MDE2205409.1 ABC transporter permease [Armatimonadota bacterium]
MPANPKRLAGLIFRKETRELFRDKRTLWSVIISPLVVTPLLLALMGLLIGTQAQKEHDKVIRVGVVGRMPTDLQTMLTPARTIDFTPIAADRVDHAILSRKLSAAISLPVGAERDLAAGKAISVPVLADEGNQDSQAAAARVTGALDAVSQQIVTMRLAARGIPADFAHPIRMVQQPLAHGGTPATAILAIMLPYVLALAAFSGGIYAAFDQVAGEKERGTLEALLVTPASRSDIVLGKFTAVVSASILSSVLSVVGMILAFSIPGKAMSWLSQGGLRLSLPAIATTLAVILPLAVLFAALLLAVSTFARNQKEAQTYMAPLFMMVVLPAMASMFIGTDAGIGMAFAPVLNVALIIKQALSGAYHPVFIATAILSSSVYASVALRFATRLFNKESVLLKA